MDAFRARSVSIEVASDFATNATATSGTVSLSSGIPSLSFTPRLAISKPKQQQMQRVKGRRCSSVAQHQRDPLESHPEFHVLVLLFGIVFVPAESLETFDVVFCPRFSNAQFSEDDVNQ